MAVTAEQRDALASQLAYLYLEKMNMDNMAPSEFAQKYFEVKKEIKSIVQAKISPHSNE